MSLSKIILTLALLLMGLGLIWSEARAQQGLVTIEITTDTPIPWKLTADQIDGDHNSEVVEATNAILTREKNVLKADFVRYFRATKWVYLHGNVSADWNGDTIVAEEAEFDMVSQTGWLKNGKMFISGPHLYFAGEHIQKNSSENYTFKNATLTACDGDSPAWSVAAEQGDIVLDGYAKLWSTSFRVKDVGVAYAPFLTVPVKQTRQSGVLTPEIGNSNNLGFMFTIPIYWAINEQNDMTFYETVMSKRGFMQGVEFRHTPDKDTKGLWRVDYLYDSLTNTGDTDYSRDNHSRFWLRGKYDGHIDEANKWRVKFDVDIVSDQDYLDEFYPGQYGFKQSRDEFVRQFNRDIADYPENLRQNAFRLTRDWDRIGLSMGLDYFQNALVGHGNLSYSEDPTLQRLPEIQAYVFKDRLWSGFPLEFQMETGVVHFWRRYGTTGTRFTATPKLTMPLNSKYITVIPGVGFTDNVYNINRYENQPGLDNDPRKQLNRFVPEISLSAFTEISKVYQVSFDTSTGTDLGADIAANFNPEDDAARIFTQARDGVTKDRRASAMPASSAKWTAIRHSVQPRLDYLYTSVEARDDIPDFDDLDNPLGKNEISYSLRNILDRRRERTLLGFGDQEGQNSALLHIDYRTFAKFVLQQSYDFKEAGRTEQQDRYPRRPFSDIYAELQIMPEDYLYFSLKNWYSPYMNKFTKQSYELTAALPSIGSVTAAWDILESVDEYKRQSRHSGNLLRVGTTITALPNWSLQYYCRADLDMDKALEQNLHVSYLHQCFSLTLSYYRREVENRLSFDFSLVGLGI